MREMKDHDDRPEKQSAEYSKTGEEQGHLTQSGVSYDPFEPHLQNRKQMLSNDGGTECFKLDLIRIIEDSKELFLVVSNKWSDIIFTRFFV